MPKTIVDQYGHVLNLGKISEFVPGPKNDQVVELQLPMGWAQMQVCPEHGLSWTHVRAYWHQLPKAVGERPAAMFRCPNGHVWSVIFQNPGEGSYA